MSQEINNSEIHTEHPNGIQCRFTHDAKTAAALGWIPVPVLKEFPERNFAREVVVYAQDFPTVSLLCGYWSRNGWFYSLK